MAGGSSKVSAQKATKGDGKKKQQQAAASHGTKSKAQKPKQKKELMKATLLSGFLGSGKTTLMRHVLTNREGIRCAVIVNEISELNLDADILAGTKLIQSDDHLVEMGNGCICCTLREDLLNQLRELARSGNYDCVLIESSGIAEPMQVAETWFVDANDAGEPMTPLQEECALDNCVTVVDASTFEDYMGAIDSVATVDESGKGAGAEGERDIASLFMDQLEFANVVVLNKIDLIPAPVREATVKRLTEIVKKLAPSASVHLVSRSKVPLSAILNTGNFSLAFANGSKDWMEDIKSGIKHVPETLEYGVSSTMFRTEVPFHPARLHAWMKKHFLLSELIPADDDDELDGEEEEEFDGDEEEEEGDEEMLNADDEEEEEEEEEEQEAYQAELAKRKAAVPKEVDEAALLAEIEVELAKRKANAVERRGHRVSRYGNLFRGKGNVFVGSPAKMGQFGVWSQAGDVLNFNAGGTWEEMPQVRNTSGDTTGTPHTLLAFVGQDLNAANLHADLNALLLTDKEQRQLKRHMAAGEAAAGKEIFEDPLASWNYYEEVEVEVDANGHGACGHDHSKDGAQPPCKEHRSHGHHHHHHGHAH